MKADEYRLFHDYTRAREVEDGIAIEVARIEWPDPSLPEPHWDTLARLPHVSSNAEIEAARRAALKDRRYFRRCRDCGERNAKGHMWTATVCMSCAEKNIGVVF